MANDGSTTQTDAGKPRGFFRGLSGFTIRWIKRAIFALLVVLATLLVARAIDSQRGPPLERWHLFVPKELSARRIDATDWQGYLEAEEAIMRSVEREVTDRLPAAARVVANRYATESPMNPARFAEEGSRDWNRSFLLEPEGEPIGAAVLLHGLTDAPYSVRHLARQYADAGFVAVAIRLPAHGTVPAALTEIGWEEWVAAARLAVREARRRVPEGPLHLVGYSMGGAAAVKYALEAIGNPALARPDRLILMSPMVGVTRFAAFAGLAGLPSVLPAFAKAAWLSILPEFNPFKYNSFPVNAARQSHGMSIALQEDIRRLARADGTVDLPPIVTFQSVLDSTVSMPDVLSALYAFLPENGSELVLFDINRSGRFDPLFRPAAIGELHAVLPPFPQRYRLTIIENIREGELAVQERTFAAGERAAQTRPLDAAYPRGMFSLSHVAIPFPLDDPLYGLEPAGPNTYGIRIGAFTARGEEGALIMSLNTLLRATSNPFFPYLTGRVAEAIADPRPTSGAPTR